MNYHIFVVLLAGGKGIRTNLPIPKQFIKIHGRYLAEYSILRFYHWFKELNESSMFIPEKMIFVSHKDYWELSKNIFNQYDLLFTIGGENRHDSTKEGLKEIKKYILNKNIPQENSVIFIHDVARPIFLKKELNMILDCFKNYYVDCISLASFVTETIVQYKDKKINPLNRNELYAIKTPQALRGNVDLFLEQPTKETYTDLITWAMDFNLKIEFITCMQENIKITYPIDFKIAEMILKLPEFCLDS